MDYNFWDDRTHELEINPCKGCEDYQGEKCISNGGCGSKQENAMYYIYDNYHEEWWSVAFTDFEDAEIEMEYLIKKRKSKDLPYDFDIYKKIT